MSAFVAIHNTLAPMQGYAPMYNFRGWWETTPPFSYTCDFGKRDRALRTAFASVRRDIWHDRESRLRATWESYG